jgi:hypothetical protein
MATITALAKSSKKYLFKKFGEKNPALKKKLQETYIEMTKSFDHSQETLKN